MGSYQVTKLTKRSVDAIQATDKDQLIWDSQLPGFGLRVKPSGAKSFLVQYRNRAGRSKRFTLGRYGVLTPDEARRMARQHLVDIERGADPATERRQARVAPTMDELMTRYLDEHVRVHNKPSTIAEVERLVRLHIRPSLGALKVSGLDRQDVIKLHRSMANTPRQANFVIAILSKSLNLAEVWQMRPDGSNPCRHVKRYPENRRERFLNSEELGRLGLALSIFAREQRARPSVIRAVRLLALTGCRLGEILNLTWKQVDFEIGALVLSDSKTGPRVHTIGSLALAELAAIPRIDGSPWVLPHSDPTKPLPKDKMERTWRRIRKEAGLEDVRLHDLRHTVGTYAGQSGANAFLVRDKLGHKTLAMTGRYVNRDTDPLRDLSDQVEERIASGLSGRHDGEVVALRHGAQHQAKRTV